MGWSDSAGTEGRLWPSGELLDELPPYFENVRSIAIGNSDLAQVTATALSSLLMAVNTADCQKVCLVLADLRGAHAEGAGCRGSQ